MEFAENATQNYGIFTPTPLFFSARKFRLIVLRNLKGFCNHNYPKNSSGIHRTRERNKKGHP